MGSQMACVKAREAVVVDRLHAVVGLRAIWAAYMQPLCAVDWLEQASSVNVLVRYPTGLSCGCTTDKVSLLADVYIQVSTIWLITADLTAQALRIAAGSAILAISSAMDLRACCVAFALKRLLHGCKLTRLRR